MQIDIKLCFLIQKLTLIYTDTSTPFKISCQKGFSPGGGGGVLSFFVDT